MLGPVTKPRIQEVLIGCRRLLSVAHTVAAPAIARARDTEVQESGQPAAKIQANRIFLLNQHKPEPTTFSEALRALRAYSLSEIAETVEVSLKADMTLKKESLVELAREAGADTVGGEELIAKVQEGDKDIDFDVCLSTPGMYEKLRPLQKKLRAKMPTPKRGTVIENITEAIAHFKHSQDYKSNKHGYVNMPIGKLDFPDEHILENLRSLLEAVGTHRNLLPMTTFIKRAVLSSTYGPGFLLTIREFL